MTQLSTRCTWALMLCFVTGSTMATAQQPGPEDQAIDQIRQLPAIGTNDQGRINDWVSIQVRNFADFAAFRKRLGDQFTHPGNSALFPSALATQLADVAVTQAAAANLDPNLARAIARSLYDMNVPETLRGLLALLASKDAATRYLCATGLASRSVKRSIAADNAKLAQSVTALRDAGVKETDPVVVGRIYEALGFASQTASVIDAYLAILDHRLTVRRTPGSKADGAERFAYSFFLEPGVVASLDSGQKAELAKRTAVLMRIDAQRYTAPKLDFTENDRIERTLWAAEEFLSGGAMLGTRGGKIRTALQAGGPANSAAVLQEVYKWVGDPTSNTPGALSAAPWNVPVGAP